MIRIEVTGDSAEELITQLRSVLGVLSAPSWTVPYAGGPVHAVFGGGSPDVAVDRATDPTLRLPRRRLYKRFAHALPDDVVLGAVRRIPEVGVTAAAKEVGRAQSWLSAVVHGRAYKDLQPDIRKILGDTYATNVS